MNEIWILIRAYLALRVLSLSWWLMPEVAETAAARTYVRRAHEELNRSYSRDL